MISAGLHSSIAVNVLMGVLVSAGCERAPAETETNAALNTLLAARAPLAAMNWDEILTIGGPLAVKQGIWETCYATSQGDFRSYLYDLEAVGVPKELVDDMSSSGAYLMAHVSCAPENVALATMTAEKAQTIWDERMIVERLKRSGEN